MDHSVLSRRSFRYLVGFSVRWVGRLLTNRLREIPSFIIIGAQRGGTTSFYNYMSGHPQFRPGILKETHFFDHYYQAGMGWYRAFFPIKSIDRKSGNEAYITGEATPYYLFHPHVPGRIHKSLPGVKLIALLRNPVDRAYSHYHHMHKNGFEKLSFEDAIAREKEILPGEISRIEAYKHYRSFAHQNYSYLARGQYVDQLINWYQFFPRNQILVLKSEEFSIHPLEILSKSFSFLGIKEYKPDRYQRYNASNYQEMNSATRSMLEDYFEPFNHRLYELLGIDFGW